MSRAGAWEKQAQKYTFVPPGAFLSRKRHRKDAESAAGGTKPPRCTLTASVSKGIPRLCAVFALPQRSPKQTA